MHIAQPCKVLRTLSRGDEIHNYNGRASVLICIIQFVVCSVSGNIIHLLVKCWCPTFIDARDSTALLIASNVSSSTTLIRNGGCDAFFLPLPKGATFYGEAGTRYEAADAFATPMICLS